MGEKKRERNRKSDKFDRDKKGAKKDKKIKKKKREHDRKSDKIDADKKRAKEDKQIKKKKRKHDRADDELVRDKKGIKKDRTIKKRKRQHDRKNDRVHKDKEGTKKESKHTGITASRKAKSCCALCGKNGTQKTNVLGRRCCATGMSRGAYKKWTEGKPTQKVRAILHN